MLEVRVFAPPEIPDRNCLLAISLEVKLTENEGKFQGAETNKMKSKPYYIWNIIA